MRFLIAGLGSIGRRHLQNLVALGYRDITLFRTHQSTLPDSELGNFPVETDLNVALAHPPTAIIVSNPTAKHLEVAIPAAEAGCNILLEKPISHTLEKIDDLETAVQLGGAQVLVGYQFRFHPTLQTAVHLIQDGAIGRPLSFRAQWGEYLPDWHPWEDYRKGYSARQDLGGGVILTLSHPLDYARWLMGDVSAVWAFVSSHSDLEIPVADSAEIGLRFTNGATGSVHLNYYQRPHAHRLEIIGTQGTLRWHYAEGTAHLYRSETKAWQKIQPPDGFERNDMFLDEMRHFIDVVHGNATPTCTLTDGRRALELALAAHSSATHGVIQTLF
jgi:predicted dehydrogenase